MSAKYANKQKPPEIVLQPRESARSYIYDFYAYITQNGQEDRFGKGGAAGLDEDLTKNKAVWEALERYSGSTIPETLELTSYNKVKTEAINPARLIHFEKDFPSSSTYRSFEGSQSIEWIEGDRENNKTQQLIPAFATYLGYNRRSQANKPFYPTTSTGLALHKTPELAKYSGILEIIERDAAMLTWLSKKKQPRIDLDSFTSPSLQKLIDKVKSEGLNVDFIITTMDIPIPSLITVIYPKDKGRPYASFGMSINTDVQKAAQKGLEEALMVRNTLELLSDQHQLPSISPKQIRTYMDHVIFYSEPSQSYKWDFLLAGPIRTLREIEEEYSYGKENLRDFDSIVDFLDIRGFDIYTVELSEKYTLDMGYYVFRVIAPELQPLSIDFNYRLINRKRLSMYSDSVEDVNKDPHPFG